MDESRWTAPVVRLLEQPPGSFIADLPRPRPAGQRGQACLVGFEEGPMNEFKATAYVKAAGVVASVVTLATLVGASYKWT
ncbi:hypothetical protein GCM10027456_54810 [Kineosporia babensis]